MIRFISSLVLGSALVIAGPMSVLDFEPFPNSSMPIPQSYGDRLANTPNVEVAWVTVSPSNSQVLSWTSGYSNLNRVVWGTSNPSVSRVEFTADAGYLVSLVSFNIGFWGGGDNNTGIYVENENGQKLWEYTTPTPSPRPQQAPLLTPNVQGQKLSLTWGNSWGIALDNITFSQSAIVVNPIPEPGTIGLALAGLAGLALLRRR